MNKLLSSRQPASWSEWQSSAREYVIDSMQRWIIFTDILRKRGNNYIAHIRSGQPPVLTFNYEMILNAKHFRNPVNYALVKITDRRKKDDHPGEDHRHHEEEPPPPIPKCPIVIIDPRAGHGPGIGGSKRDSEIGMALNNGHPVYFILFFTEPIPGQTLAHVEEAMGQFIEKVAELHPYDDAPAIMGNCQAGWAAALLCANRPDITGSLVLNGAPLSYWSGVAGANPMRYMGGLVGGVWFNSFLSDLGNGIFDGANLVANFESLNPGHTLWTKQYNVYAHIDTEEDRYLEFEKWWGGFFMMTTAEIHFIVDSLFVGNKLERGELELRDGVKISLKNIRKPILVFASLGDNITPAQQALNWIPRVYISEDDIKRHGQTIIYIIHKEIGHLGIFVASSIAKKEHNEIIANFDMIAFMPPGLFEMIIEGDVLSGNFTSRYEARTFADLAAYDDGAKDEEDFGVVKKVSELNDNIYQVMVHPWIKLWTTELSAEIIRNLHPLRIQRYAFADINPLMRPLKQIASIARNARKNREQASPDNLFTALENDIAEYIKNILNIYRDYRDLNLEQLFRLIYGSNLLRNFFPPDEEETPAPGAENEPINYDQRMLGLEEGGVAEGLLRIFVAIARLGNGLKRSYFDVSVEIASTHKVLGTMPASKIKMILHEQGSILQGNSDRALKALHVLIKNKNDRMDALEIARRLCTYDGKYTREEKTIIEKIKKGLKL